MTDIPSIPPSIQASLTERESFIVDHWLTKQDFLLSMDEFHKLLGGIHQQYDSHVTAFFRLRKKLGPLCKQKMYGCYQLAAVGPMIAPEQYYAQVIFGKENTPFDTAERFIVEDDDGTKTRPNLTGLTRVFWENRQALQDALENLLDPHTVTDPSTVAILEAYADGLKSFAQAYNVFAYHFRILAQAAKERRVDYQLYGDKQKFQTLLTLLAEKEGA